MFARLPPTSSDLAERKCVVPPPLLQIGGANIEKLVTSFLFAKREGVFCSPLLRSPAGAYRRSQTVL
jgi:hypothetical protein